MREVVAMTIMKVRKNEMDRGSRECGYTNEIGEEIVERREASENDEG